MKLPDANLLIYAANENAEEHATACAWIESALSGTEAVGFAWLALIAFVRITTRHGLFPRPLRVTQAFDLIELWLSAPCAQIVHPGNRHLDILRELLGHADTAGNLTGDAHLAALAIEHGAELWSFDSDFRRFKSKGLRWLDPADA